MSLRRACAWDTHSTDLDNVFPKPPFPLGAPSKEYVPSKACLGCDMRVYAFTRYMRYDSVLFRNLRACLLCSRIRYVYLAFDLPTSIKGPRR